MTAEKDQRLIQLDALRGIAALWVVLYHLTTRFLEIYPQSSAPVFSLPDGRHGVHLFFMISGYVILMTLDKAKSALDFAVSRFCRLFPTYWLSVLITFSIVSYFGLPGREVTIRDALINLSMIPEALGVSLVDNCYWSLQVELFFYVLMATLVFSGQRKNLILILAILVAADLALLLAWGDSANSLPKPLKALRLLLGLRFLHLFLFGIICYQRKIDNKWYYLPLLVFCILTSLIEKKIDHSLIIAAIGMVFFLATNFQISLFRSKFLIFFGFISYPFYLLHQNIGYVIIRFFQALGTSHSLCIVIAFITAVILACALSYTVEHPFNSWLRKQYRNLRAK
ncbi:MAG: acyltransferase [Proteobacteria bacterium]|nr:acyltransferase [Pseudomonadota bacterium]